MVSGKSLFRFLFLTSVVLLPPAPWPLYAQEKEQSQSETETSDPVAKLEAKRLETEAELKALSETLSLSGEKISELEADIAALENRATDIRSALVESAEKRNELEGKIDAGEAKLAELRGRESDIRASLYERRGLLAEVLGALERMGRNPPPAILVKPSDALGSVRSAILLGAVVPGIRNETETLLADLQELTRTLAAITTERESLKQLMVSRLEEEKRMNLLLEENQQQASRSTQTLAEEQKRAEELAAKAGSMQELMASLEAEIGSVRDAQRRARELDKQRAEENDGASSFDPNRLPDKNRIAPAFAFSSLKGRLALPVRGDVVGAFGDAQGGGRKAQGMTVVARPNALVTAPADGWIIFAGKFRSFGQMVILDVGENYRIVMTGMEKVNVRPGQFVVAGEPVAEMGATRIASAAALSLETEGPTLYIEFWQNKNPIDSRSWWSAQITGKANNDT